MNNLHKFSLYILLVSAFISCNNINRKNEQTMNEAIINFWSSEETRKWEIHNKTILDLFLFMEQD